MTHNDEIWVPISDKQQIWWRVVCTYDGKPGCVCAAVGSTVDEAKANKKRASALCDAEQ
jgi:hypothetical protein